MPDILSLMINFGDKDIRNYSILNSIEIMKSYILSGTFPVQLYVLMSTGYVQTTLISS